MRLYFIDESGTLMGDQQPFFVLVAVGLDARQWDTADKELMRLKQRLVPWARPDDVEIKARMIRRGEGFFAGQDWATRLESMDEARGLLVELGCEVLGVQVFKSRLPETIATDTDLYRLAFWRLLGLIDDGLRDRGDLGMLMLDMRSDMHSAVQDRRLVDAYREWRGQYAGTCRIVGLPWFGFSAFYPGLQLADIAAYAIDAASRPSVRDPREETPRWCRPDPSWRIVQIP